MTHADYDIHRCSRHCAASGRELAPGEAYYSVLLRAGANMERRDYAAEAWQEPPAEAIGWWKSIVPEREAKKTQLAPSEVLLQFFHSLADRPSQADVRYVLALLMVRKRVLRLEETRTDDEGRELLVLYAPRDESTHEVPAVLPDEARLTEIQDELSRLLFARAT